MPRAVSRCSVLELGGGNSCFLDGLMQQFTMAPYVILDNSPEGMRLARERFAPAYGDTRRAISPTTSSTPTPIAGSMSSSASG